MIVKIIIKEPNASGGYPSPQECNFNFVPEGWALIPDELDMTDFYEYNGFVTLTIESDSVEVETSRMEMTDEGEILSSVIETMIFDKVVSYEPNLKAWGEWKNNLPDPAPAPVSPEQRIKELEKDNAQLRDALRKLEAFNEERFSAIENALCELDMLE